VAVYLIASVIAGLVSAAYAMMGHDAGVFQALLWYVLGGWAGLGLMIVLTVLGRTARPTPPDAPRGMPTPQRA